MGDFDKARVLDVFEMLQLPSDVERYMDGRSPDVEGWGNVALQGVAHHQQILREDVQVLTELLEFHLGLIRRNLHM